MLKKVLYPTDLSERSRNGLRWMAEHVARKDSEVLLFHVVNPAAGMDTPTLVQEAEEELGVLEKDLEPFGLVTASAAAAGDEVETIARFAHAEGCSLVFFLVKPDDDVLPVVRQIALPQMLVPLVGEEMPQAGLFGNVVVATDLSPERTDVVLERLGKILGGEEASIVLLHAVPLEDPATAEDLVMAADEALEAVKESVAGWHLPVSTRLVSGEPEAELPQIVEELAPSLLVLGLPRHGDLWELLVGGTAEVLIRSSKCPLLLIPA